MAAGLRLEDDVGPSDENLLQQHWRIFVARGTWSARDAKDHFSKVVDAARRSPQTVTKHGKPAVVIVDVAEYGRLRNVHRADVPSLVELLFAMPQGGDQFPPLKTRTRELEF
jgi:antitoxin Phd